MTETLNAFIARNEHGELLLFTIRYQKDAAMVALTWAKKQEWLELQAEGYSIIPVTVTAA